MVNVSPLAAVHWEPRPAMPAIHDAFKQSDTAREMPSMMSIQRALSSLGYDPGPIDGLMGPRTHGAITAYEEARGWDSSGTASSRLRDALIADLPPESRAMPVSGRDADEGALLSDIRSPATTTDPTDAEAATNRPVSILVQSATANAPRCQAAEAEPGSDIELAVAEFFHALRSTAQFAVRIFVGPRSRDLTTTKEGSGIRGSDRPAAIRNGTGSHCSPTSGRIARAAAGTRASGALSGPVHPANSP